MIAPRHLRGAGEDDAVDMRVGHEFRPEPPVAHQDMQRGSGDARLVHQRHGLGGDQRSLLGRFGDDGIAADQRRHDLAGEDRQREVPPPPPPPQGEIATNTPRPRMPNRLLSPVGPGSSCKGP